MRLNNVAPQEEKDRYAVKEDALLTMFRELTPQQIESYFENNLSGLSQASETEIETYINNIGSIADVKAALLVLAKDSAFNSTINKKLTVAVAFLLRTI